MDAVTEPTLSQTQGVLVEALCRRTLRNYTVRIWQFTLLFFVTLYYHCYNVLFRWHDRDEHYLEYQNAKLSGRGLMRAMRHTYTVEGAENVENLDYYAVACNHMSYLDWVLMLAAFPDFLRIIAKEELRRIPFVGSHLAHCGVLIDRGDGVAALKAITGAVKDASRVPIQIFPEGTRSYDGTLQPFKRPGLKVFVRQGLPIVPTVITNTFAHFPRGAVCMRFGGHFRMIVGKPLFRKDFDSDEAMLDAVEKFIRDTFAAEEGR